MDHSLHAVASGKLPSERNFGFTVGGILLAIACLRAWRHAEIVPYRSSSSPSRTILLVLAVLQPTLLRLPNRLWMKLGDLLFMVMNPVVMFAVYVTTFVPIGMYLRLSGKDSPFRKLDRSASTYWNTRNLEGGKTSDLTHQF